MISRKVAEVKQMTQLEEKTTQPDSFEASYFAPLFEAEERHFWFQARNHIIADVVESQVKNLAPGYKIVEIGCGNGNTLQVLERVCRTGLVVGMDLFIEGLRYARNRTNCDLVQANLYEPPFSESFDLIGLFDVLEHLNDDVAVLESLYKLLSVGGHLVLTVPAYRVLWSYFDELAHHQRRYERMELEFKLAQAGFEVEYLSFFMTSLFPLMWLKRKLSAALGRSESRMANKSAQEQQQDLEVEFKISPTINTLLGQLLKWEQFALARRWRLPFGTSLLIVARKN